MPLSHLLFFTQFSPFPRAPFNLLKNPCLLAGAVGADVPAAGVDIGAAVLAAGVFSAPEKGILGASGLLSPVGAGRVDPARAVPPTEGLKLLAPILYDARTGLPVLSRTLTSTRPVLGSAFIT
jgi:hypothetical protein